MRIAILTNSVVSTGGAGRIVNTQERLLRECGHEVRVFCPTISWFSSPPMVRLFHHLNDLRARMDQVSSIVEWKPDLLITHNLTGCGFKTPGEIKRQAPQMRWIHILHDVQLFEPSGQLKSADMITALQKIWSWLRGRALGNPDLVLSPTAWLLEEHRRRFIFQNTHAHVLPNPAPFTPIDHSPDLRPAFVVSEQRPLRLLYVGRLSKDKGSDILRNIARTVSIPFELFVVGEGPERASVCQSASAVIGIGELSPEGVEEQMRRADVLLVPSCIEENQPTVILEAARLALPVIASTKGGIPETLNGAGMIVDPENHQAWVQAIESLQQPITYADQVVRMMELSRRYDPREYIQRLEAFVTTNL